MIQNLQLNARNAVLGKLEADNHKYLVVYQLNKAAEGRRKILGIYQLAGSE